MVRPVARMRQKNVFIQNNKGVSSPLSAGLRHMKIGTTLLIMFQKQHGLIRNTKVGFTYFDMVL